MKLSLTEVFSTIQEELDKERKTIMKQWATREANRAGHEPRRHVGGFAGKSLLEIEGLEMKELGVIMILPDNVCGLFFPYPV